jgi:hypothetical protein
MRELVRLIQILLAVGLAVGSVGLALKAMKEGKPDAWLGVTICGAFAIGLFALLRKGKFP